MKKIMVVDDDRPILEMIGGLLTDVGYETVLFSRSDGIPEKVAKEKPDLILLDVLMAPKHGMEVLASLQDLAVRPPVILISAAIRGVRDIRQIAQGMGCVDFIEKPFDVSDLLARVETALANASEPANQ